MLFSPTASLPCPVVQPGAYVDLPNFACTLGFIFRGSDGHLYADTAGHCALSSNIGQVATENNGGSGIPIGRLVFRVANDVTPPLPSYAVQDDFALIRLLPTDRVDPAVFQIGGPHGLYTGTSSSPVWLTWVGQGLQPVAGTPARKGLATAVTRANTILFTGPGNLHDSGAPVLIDGEAACVLTGFADLGAYPLPYYGLPTPSGDPGDTTCIRLDTQLPLAERALHIKLTLVDG